MQKAIQVTPQQFEEFARMLFKFQNLHLRMKQVFDSAPSPAFALHHFILKDWWMLQDRQRPVLVPKYINEECVNAYVRGMLIDDLLEERSDVFRVERALKSAVSTGIDYSKLDKKALLAIAKDMGIKGVNKRWREQTIRQKIEEKTVKASSKGKSDEY